MRALQQSCRHGKIDMCDWKGLRKPRHPLQANGYIRKTISIRNAATAIEAILERMRDSEHLRLVSWTPERILQQRATRALSQFMALQKPSQRPSKDDGGALVKPKPRPHMPRPGGAAVKVWKSCFEDKNYRSIATCEELKSMKHQKATTTQKIMMHELLKLHLKPAGDSGLFEYNAGWSDAMATAEISKTHAPKLNDSHIKIVRIELFGNLRHSGITVSAETANEIATLKTRLSGLENLHGKLCLLLYGQKVCDPRHLSGNDAYNAHLTAQKIPEKGK